MVRTIALGKTRISAIAVGGIDFALVSLVLESNYLEFDEIPTPKDDLMSIPAYSRTQLSIVTVILHVETYSY